MSIQHPMCSIEYPILIVGGGLAGMTVAWRLWERGVRFVVVDPDRAETCSKVAAGLITPITGMRLNVSWRLAEMLPVAREFYAKVTEVLGVKVHHEVPQVRLLKNEREKKLWEQRRSEAETQPWVDRDAPNPLVNGAVFHAEFGGFQQQHSGWLDAALYLRASRDFFAAQGSWMTGEVRDRELRENATGVEWNGGTYEAVVLCRGAEERNASRFFPWLEWDCARGVIARVDAPIQESRIVNRGCWLLPRDGAWRAGSTYEFDFNAPVEKSVEALRKKVAGLLRVPFELSDAKMGVRPILKHKRVTMGRHPAHARAVLFNGLGSKGALQAPFFARQLVEHVVDGAAIEEMVDVGGNG